MNAERDARRNARCLRPSLRSASSARSSARSRLVSGGLLVGVEERHVRRRTIGPVGVVRQLDRDAQIATLAARLVDLDESLTGVGRPNIHPRAFAGPIVTRVDRAR